jgi:hypothetical protein
MLSQTYHNVVKTDESMSELDSKARRATGNSKKADVMLILEVRVKAWVSGSAFDFFFLTCLERSRIERTEKERWRNSDREWAENNESLGEFVG